MNFKKVVDLIRQYSQNWQKNTLYAAGLVAILLLGGWFWYQGQNVYVPQEFYDARSRAGEVSTRIKGLTDASVVTLGQISSADQAGSYERGLTLVLEDVDRNSEIKGEAIKLSEELKIMALNLGAVKPDKAASAGLDAATAGLELVQHLINYNNYSQELLAVIQTRLRSNGSPETRQKIEQIILKMNEEAETINSLNEKYQEKMRGFDELVK